MSKKKYDVDMELLENDIKDFDEKLTAMEEQVEKLKKIKRRQKKIEKLERKEREILKKIGKKQR